jgi:hypothetical protein
MNVWPRKVLRRPEAGSRDSANCRNLTLTATPEPCITREHDELRTLSESKLREYMVDVVADRLFGDLQACCDVTVSHPGSDEIHDAAFGRGQVIERQIGSVGP